MTHMEKIQVEQQDVHEDPITKTILKVSNFLFLIECLSTRLSHFNYAINEDSSPHAKHLQKGTKCLTLSKA